MRCSAAVLVACASSCPVSAGVLWDNGDWDGSGGYSNGVEEILEGRRTLLDDFEVPSGTTWYVEALVHRHIWDSEDPGAGTAMEVRVRNDNGNTPGDVREQLIIESYCEVSTGLIFANRVIAESRSEFERLALGPGRYWLEATIVGPEVNFWLTRREFRLTECWVNYEALGGLMPGSEHFHQEPRDLNWHLVGTVEGECPSDLDGDGAVGFGDVIAILSTWGPCNHPTDCPEDLDGDGMIGFSDLLLILGEWGPCP